MSPNEREGGRVRRGWGVCGIWGYVKGVRRLLGEGYFGVGYVGGGVRWGGGYIGWIYLGRGGGYVVVVGGGGGTLGGGTLGRFVGGGGVRWWGDLREELVKNAVFGHLLENYHILAASG